MNLINNAPSIVEDASSAAQDDAPGINDDELIEVTYETCDADQIDQEEAVDLHNFIEEDSDYDPFDNVTATTGEHEKMQNGVEPYAEHFLAASGDRSSNARPVLPDQKLNKTGGKRVATVFPLQSSKRSDEFGDVDEKLYKCHVCSMQFARHSSLMWHMQSHENAKGKKTDHGDSFSLENISQFHRKTSFKAPILQENGLFTCGFCNKEFESSKSVKQHISRAHKFETPINTTPAYETGLSFPCEQCHRAFVSLKAMKVHVSHMHTRVDSEYPNENGLFSCNICEKEFVSTRARSIHAAHAHISPAQPSEIAAISAMDSSPNEDGRFSCSVCDKDFPSLISRKIHVSHMHKTPNGLITNITTSSIDSPPVVEKDFSCDYCAKVFDSAKGKSVHVSHMHKSELQLNDTTGELARSFSSVNSVPALDEGGPFSCDYCDKEFDSEKGRRVHISRLHKFEAPEDPAPDEETNSFTCNICFKEFASEKAVRVHVWHRHRFASQMKNVIASPGDTFGSVFDDSNFVSCEICDKEFETSKALKIHVAHMHKIKPVENGSGNSFPGVNIPSECEFCGLEFGSLEALKVHKSHKHAFTSGQHYCETCNKGFVSLRAKKIHLSRAHTLDEVSMGSTQEKSGEVLKKIAELVPNPEPKLVCHLCQRTFWCKKGLSRHIGYHKSAMNLSLPENDTNATLTDGDTLDTGNYSSEAVTNESADDGMNGSAVDGIEEGADNTVDSINESADNANESTVDETNESALDNVDESLQCPQCDKIFETSKAVRIHLSRMHTGTSIQFEREENSSQPESERTHPLPSKPANSNKITGLQCVFCDHNFETVQQMNVHIMMEHKNEKSFRCIFCKKSFSAPESYYIHIQGTCGTAEKIDGVYLFPCGKCSRNFSHPYSVRPHWAAHHGPKQDEALPNNAGTEDVDVEKVDGGVKCPLCSNTYASVKGLAGHLKVHKTMGRGKKIEFECVVCHKQFVSPYARNAHMKFHVRKDREANNSASTENIDVSQEIQETDISQDGGYLDSEAPLEQCSFDDDKSSNLDAKSHDRPDDHADIPEETKAEEGVKELKCPLCPKTFHKSKALANHSRIHEFKCQLCPKAFISIIALKSHLKSHDHPKYHVSVSTLPTEDEDDVDVSATNDVDVSATNDVDASATNDVDVSATNDVDVSATDDVEMSSDVPTEENIESGVRQGDEYKCPYCPRSFRNLKGISTHSRVHRTGAVYEEPVKKATPTPPKVKVAEEKKSHKCPFCSKSFPNAKAVAVHSRIHKGDNIFPSPASIVKVSTDTDENKHIGPFQCPICLKSFATEKGLFFHKNVHSEDEHKCLICKRTFTNVKGLAGHMKYHRLHPEPVVVAEPEPEKDVEEDKDFPCQYCERIFTTYRGYARHVFVHTHISMRAKNNVPEIEEPPTDDKLFTCRYCGLKFASGKQLGGHMRHHSHVLQKNPDAYNSIHIDTDGVDVELINEEAQLICDTCDEVFESKEELSEHVRNHTLDPLLSVETSQDDTLSSTQTSNSGFMMCHICDRLFSSQRSLNAHMFKKHRWVNRKSTFDSQKRTSTFTPVNQNQSNLPTISRKRSISPGNVFDVESEFVDDPIRVPTMAAKRIRRSIELERRNGASSNPRLAFGLRNNGEVFVKNHPNLAAQFHDKTYGCMHCEKRYSEKSELLQHVRTHPECENVAGEDLENQVNAHNRERFVVQTREGAEEHFIFEQFDSADGYRCSECDESFRDKLQMLIHMAYHMDSKLPNGDFKSLLIKADCSLLAPYKCNFCGQRFINKKYRNLHLCKHHRNDILQCEICQKLFICKETLKQHYEQHAQDKRYQCEFCGKCFRSKVVLKRHTQMQCESREGNAAETETDRANEGDPEIVIDQHFIKEEPLEAEPEQADFEDMEVENPLHLNGTSSMTEEFDSVEQKYKSEGMLSFVCECCSKRFASESDVQTHENQPQKLLFCCGLCNLYFIDTKGAELHSKMHIVESDVDLDEL